MITRLLLVILVYAAPLISTAQQLEVEEVLSPKEIKIRNTTKWAACIPGSGQVINRKYWKAPIVWGGLAVSVYFISDNTLLMNEFKEAWKVAVEDDVFTLTDTNGALYTLTDLEVNTYLYRRNRDLSYLSFLGIYLLQIVDANVDAHMRFFDADEDLSFSISPPYSYRNRTDIWQVGLKFNFTSK
jgi:hypothetical protein